MTEPERCARCGWDPSWVDEEGCQVQEHVCSEEEDP